MPRTLVGRLALQNALLLTALIVIFWVVEQIIGDRHPEAAPFVGLVVLIAIAVFVGTGTWLVGWRTQRLWAADDQARRRASLVAENEAVARVTQVIAQEIAEPLSLALGYSEFMLMHGQRLSLTERRNLERVHEAMWQMTQMLQVLRHLVDTAPSITQEGRRLADDVSRAIVGARPRRERRGHDEPEPASGSTHDDHSMPL